jgi:hypothetical protein
VLIGLATLAKLYPLLLLVAVLCRRDWGLLIAVLTTLLLGYLPFLILGHGQVIGFLPTYLTEQYPNAGPVPLAMRWVGSHLGLTAGATLLLQFAVDVLLMGTICMVLLRLRWRERISMEASTLVLLGTLFAVSSHVFPWYLPTFLPWVALSISPVWVQRRPTAKGLAIVLVWYFTSTALLSYFFSHRVDWQAYYALVYDVVLLGLALTVAVALRRARGSLPTKEHLLL